MWDFDPDNLQAPEGEAVQAEREIWEDITRNEAEPMTAEAVVAGPDECDRCGKRRSLFHNEATGLALCEACDRITDGVEALVPETMPVTWKRLRNGGWGVLGPAGLLVTGSEVVVTKRSGETQRKRVRRVLWTGEDRDGREISIATVGKA